MRKSILVEFIEGSKFVVVWYGSSSATELYTNNNERNDDLFLCKKLEDSIQVCCINDAHVQNCNSMANNQRFKKEKLAGSSVTG